LKALQCMTGIIAISNNTSCLNSFTSFISRIVSHSAEDRLKYSAYVVLLRAVSDYSQDLFKIGHQLIGSHIWTGILLSQSLLKLVSE
jgi:hypothetical protein